MNENIRENDRDIGEEEFEDEELIEDEVEEVIVDDLEAGSESEDEEQIDADEQSQAPIRDDADFVFKGHTGPVFCCALDPKNSNVAVTGSQDDKALVWEIHSGQILFECTGHTDSVTMVAFSYDGSYIATGDMRGLVQVWRVATRALVWSDTVGELSWVQWHHGTNALLVAVTSGELFMWKIPSGECKVVSWHGAASDCAIVMPDGRRAAVGYADGLVKLVELKSGSVLGQATTGSGPHEAAAVSCIDAHDNNVIAAGTADGKVVLFKTQPLKAIWTQQDAGNSYVEAIFFNRDPMLPLLAAGTLSGKLYILDFTKQAVRHCCEAEKRGVGVCRLAWDRHSPVVFTGGTDGALRLYDARSGTLQARLLGHSDTILDLCLSTDGNSLLSASDDNTCRVFAVSAPER